MKNDAIHAIMTRSSIRGFHPEPLAEEEIRIILDAALAAPSGLNKQPWRFIAVTNRELITKIEQDTVQHFLDTGNTAVNERMKSRSNKVIYDAPLYIIIALDPAVSEYAGVNAGIAVQNMVIAAKSIGLDSVILGMPAVVFSGSKAEEYKKALNFPAGFEFGISVAIGRAAMEKKPHALEPEKIIRVD